MKINFVTPTKLSLIDITSMGDSSKRGDEKTIGAFDSGLKYSIALLLRHNVGIRILVAADPILHETYEEPVVEMYEFDTFIEECPNTDKKKELIKVLCSTTPLGGAPINPHDMREPSQGEQWEVKTGFAKALGYNWELFMALRELWSNMLDEGGCVNENTYDETDVEGTIITLEFEATNPFYEIWQNRHLYINEKPFLYKLSNRVEVLENKEGYLRIYKQNILVHEDRDMPSRYAWNIHFGELDERRLLRNVSSVENSIAEAICYTTNEDFLREIVTADFQVKEKEFLSNSYTYASVSDKANDIATEVYSEHGVVKSYDWVITKIRGRKDCKINGKTLKTVEDSLWNYSKTVTIETVPCPVYEEVEIVDDQVVSSSSVLQQEIDKIYNFKVDVEVKTAKLKGNKVVADKYDNCLIIDDAFDVATDFADFIVEYIDLTRKGNVVKNLAEYVLNLIKK